MCAKEKCVKRKNFGVCHRAKRSKKKAKDSVISVNTIQQYPHTYPKYCPQCLNIYIEKLRRKGKGTSWPVGDLGR